MKKLIAVSLCSFLMTACCARRAAEPETAAGVMGERAMAVEPVSYDVKDNAIETIESCVAIDFRYPTFGNAAVDKRIEAFVNEEMEAMRGHLIPLCADLDPNIAADENGAKYAFGYFYEVLRADSEAIDILFTGHDYTGGAHDNTWLRTFMFDPATGVVLPPLSVVDGDEARAVEKLSEVSRVKLRETLDASDVLESMIDEGTKPEAENFRKIVRTETGVRVYFDPYQVAPWSAGIVYIDL